MIGPVVKESECIGSVDELPLLFCQHASLGLPSVKLYAQLKLDRRTRDARKGTRKRTAHLDNQVGNPHLPHEIEEQLYRRTRDSNDQKAFAAGLRECTRVGWEKRE